MSYKGGADKDLFSHISATFSLIHIIHKFQTTLPGIRRDIVFERIFLSDIPTAYIYEFKRQKPSESRRNAGTRMSENAIFCRILTIVYE